MRINAFGVVALVSVLVNCREASAQARSVAADAEAIRRVYESFAAADKAGDPARQAGFITNDAVFMPPGTATFVGRPAILKRWTDRAAVEVTEEFTISLEEIVVAGDWAFTRGTCRWRGHRRGQATVMEERCRRLDVLRRQPDGSWLIARHIRNSSEGQ